MVIVAACAIGLSSIPLLQGHIGLSWDALNHHIYLGWMADRPRFDQDLMAASYQAYQYPYLYWPVYKLAMAGASGVQAGLALALLQLPVVPAIWLIARACVPGREVFDVAMRSLAVALAFLNGIVLSMFDTTGNDLLAAIPLLWAIAVALRPLAGGGARPSALARAALLSGLLAGVSVAFKLSNAPVAIVLPLLWVWGRDTMSSKARRLVQAGLGAVAGFAMAYGYWGWQLWTHFGNPIFPLYDNWFESLRDLSGWRP